MPVRVRPRAPLARGRFFGFLIKAGGAGGGDALGDFTHAGFHGGDVDREKLPVFHDDAAVDDRRADVFGAGGVNECGIHVVERDQVGALVIENDDVREFAGLKGAEVFFAMEGAGAAEGGHLDHFEGGHDVAVFAVEFVELGDVAELADDIEGVAAHGAVGAKADAEAVVVHLEGGGNAFGGFDVGDYVVGDADVAGFQKGDVGVVDEDAMPGDEARGEQADGVEVFDRGLVALFAESGDFVGHLGDVHEHGQIEFGG